MTITRYCEPVRWQVCFATKADTPWVNWLVPGRFKHVRAFGFVPHEEIWIFVDVTMRGTSIRAARDRNPSAHALMQQFVRDSAVVIMPAGEGIGVRVPGWFCTAAIKQLVRIRSGALLPDAFYRDCLAQGGQPLDEFQRPAAPTGAGHPA